MDHPEIFGIPTGAPISDKKKKKLSLNSFYKLYISTILKWRHLKKSCSNSQSSCQAAQPEAKSQVSQEQDTGEETGKPKMNGVHSYRYNSDSMQSNGPVSPRHIYRSKTVDSYCFPRFSASLSRNGSRRSPSPTPSFMSRTRSASKANNESNYGFTSSLSRNASGRSTAPIMFSNSTGMIKPQAVQKNLECTLEELCYGCMKKIKVTREVLTCTGKAVQQEEILTIDVKPGWKEGTTITFEGMGNERPGCCPADITFVIAEKQHPLFRREGDDLEIAVEIPLVQALTGCEILIPLLGGENMTLMINDIIYPGYEKIIREQGMPNTREQGKRGNLKVIFLVDFPEQLTDKQRSDILSILEDSC